MKKQIISQPRKVPKPYSLAQILFTLDTKERRKKENEYFTVRLTVSIYPLPPPLTVSFLWNFFGVLFILEHDSMCSEMDFTPEKLFSSNYKNLWTPPYCCCCSATKQSLSGIAEALKALKCIFETTHNEKNVVCVQGPLKVMPVHLPAHPSPNSFQLFSLQSLFQKTRHNFSTSICVHLLLQK